MARVIAPSTREAAAVPHAPRADSLGLRRSAKHPRTGHVSCWFAETSLPHLTHMPLRPTDEETAVINPRAPCGDSPVVDPQPDKVIVSLKR